MREKESKVDAPASNKTKEKINLLKGCVGLGGILRSCFLESCD
jgi:hypothetical protein